MDLHITFRDETHSEALHAYVERKALRLDHAKGRPHHCRVVMEAPHRRHNHGRHYRVRIDLTIPGFNLIAGSVRKDDDVHADAYAAVDDAFDDAQRLLDDHHARVLDLARRACFARAS